MQSAIRILVALATFVFATSSMAQASLQVRYVTFNVSFGSNAAQVDADIQKIKPNADIMMFQEAKWVTIADSFGTGFTTYQVLGQGDAKAGSALAVRNSVGTVLATGLQFGVDSNGEDMLDRYIAWADVKLSNGLVIRIMSLHMPPQRYQYLQPIMADNLVAFIAQSPYPVVVGADWNYTVTNDPYNIQGRAGLVAKGVGIDGIYYDDLVSSFVSVTEMTGLNVNSDHDPVRVIANMQIPTYIVDNSSAGFSASTNWQTGTSAADKYGSNYRFRSTQAVTDVANWTTTLTAGRYNVYAWWCQGANRSTTAPYKFPDDVVVKKNQQTGGGQWNLIGTRDFSGSTTMRLTCWTTSGYVVVADAIKFGP